MIDIWTTCAQASVARLRELSRTPSGIFLQAALSSIAGIVILLVFLAMIVSPMALAVLLSGVIASNGAISGYALLEKGGRSIRAERSRLIAMALLLCAAGCLALYLMHPWLRFINALSLPLYVGLSLAATFTGAWLASQKQQPEKSKTTTMEDENLPQTVD